MAGGIYLPVQFVEIESYCRIYNIVNPAKVADIIHLIDVEILNDEKAPSGDEHREG